MVLRKETIESIIKKLRSSHSLSKKELKELLTELHIKISTLHHVATHDEKTGLYNYSFFKEIFNIELAQASRGKSLSLILTDIDFFKKVNDVHGHVFADMLLKRVSTVLLKELRPYDVLARFGGEEFIILLPNTALTGAKITAEKLRKKILNDIVLSRYGLTMSFGVSSFKNGDNSDSLMEKADKALYKAKHEGRNLVRG